MKPTVVADEMFPEGAGPYMDLEEAGASGSLLMDLAANEKAVHTEFFNGTRKLAGKKLMKAAQEKMWRMLKEGYVKEATPCKTS